MPVRQYYLLAGPVIASDRAVLRALQDIIEYAPRNPDLSTAALVEHEAKLEQIETALKRACLALEALRDEHIQAQWAFHERIIRAKCEIITQFGADSPAVHAIGLKKRSERKRRSRRRSTAPA